MCFFVVLEAKVAPSIPPCIDCTRMLTEDYILLWLLKYDDHHRLSIDGLAFFFFFFLGGGVESMVTDSNVLADTAVIFKGLVKNIPFIFIISSSGSLSSGFLSPIEPKAE